jgi:predicted phosphohydrolase
VGYTLKVISMSGVQVWFSKDERERRLDTPTEKIMGSQKQLRRGIHRSTRALEEAIRTYIAVSNTHPPPFVWTKTADQILASVQRFCRRISDSRD